MVLAWHESQVAMVCPLPVPGDLHTLAATSKMWENNVQQKSWGTLGGTCVGLCDGEGRLHHSWSMRAGEGGA